MNHLLNGIIMQYLHQTQKANLSIMTFINCTNYYQQGVYVT